MDKAVKHGDLGTPERHNRKELVKEVVDKQLIARVKTVPPLDNYYNRNQIDAAQRDAGKKLYNSWVVGSKGFHSCEYRQPVDGGGKELGMTEAVVQARRNYDIGINAIKTEYQKKIVDDVCVEEVYISDMSRRWRVKLKLKAELKAALSDMARAYGFL